MAKDETSTKNVTVTLTNDQAEYLTARAKQLETSRSHVARMIIRDSMNATAKEKSIK